MKSELESNIVLAYPITVLFAPGMEVALIAPDGCEVFVDEHNIQWVKFYPNNGPYVGREHMIRTSNVVIVRTDR